MIPVCAFPTAALSINKLMQNVKNCKPNQYVLEKAQYVLIVFI